MTFSQHWQPTLGAVFNSEGRCQFCVWAPQAKSVEVHLLGENERYVQMERADMGYYRVVVDDISAGQHYRYRLDSGEEYPDPASRCQPEGVYGPSEVVDSGFNWTDAAWRGVPLQDYIIYELHVGTYTGQGTFEAIIPHLDGLVELGITALELMPVTQFPGERNWGYDGVFPFAAQNSYGDPDGLRKLVDACHHRGLAVILDVVYNHFGPEGNCLLCYAPYTTDTYKTPWGQAMNFDGEYSDEVRAYFIENALYWFYEFHLDALRLDATHFMYDFRPITFLEELTEAVHQHAQWLKREIFLIAEDDKNDVKLTRPLLAGGYGMDAQWNDDFHHAMYSLVMNVGSPYYEGFGSIDSMVKAMREGFVLTNTYSSFRKRRHGTSSRETSGDRLIIFNQNHDQIGNHMPAERLMSLASFDAIKLMIGLVALSPYVPMIFMGEEYGETALFNFFVHFQDENLIEAVRNGRKKAFAAFFSEGFEPPDPQAESTFLVSKLNHELKAQGKHRVLLEFHRRLFTLRKTLPALYELNKERMEVHGYTAEQVIVMRRWNANSQLVAAFSFADRSVTVTIPMPVGYWCKELDSAAPRWTEDALPDMDVDEEQIQSLGEIMITLAPRSFVLYSLEP